MNIFFAQSVLLFASFITLDAEEILHPDGPYLNICYLNHGRGDSMLLITDKAFKPVCLVFKNKDLVVLIGNVEHEGKAENLTGGAYIEMDLSQTSIIIKRTSFGTATRIINNGKSVEFDSLEESIREGDDGSFSSIFFSSRPDLLSTKLFLQGVINASQIEQLIKNDNQHSKIRIVSDVSGVPKL